MDEVLFQKLPGALLGWYEANRRALPWRADREAYHIWLSEIMLQQTRVEAVKGYYARFLEAIPTIADLARCDDELLHKLWEGLGYYSRVRNLKKAAGVIMSRFGGEFPRKYEDVLSLPGIGEYTAGAICSIAFNQPRAAVDGNVLRLIARLTATEEPMDTPAMKKAVRAALEAVYPAQCGEFTQALMELGATVCGPDRAPRCEKCPCNDFCRGHKRGMAERLPVKAPKRERKVEEKTVFMLSCGGYYALKKRPEDGLLALLWQFPDVPGKLELKEALAAVEKMGLTPLEVYRQVERKHIFTHIQWNMRGFYLEVAEAGGDLTWMTREQIEGGAALPTAYRQFWEREGIGAEGDL